jgi:hypothetical protein
MHALFGYADVPLWLTIVRTAFDGAHAIRERATSTNLWLLEGTGEKTEWSL